MTIPYMSKEEENTFLTRIRETLETDYSKRHDHAMMHIDDLDVLKLLDKVTSLNHTVEELQHRNKALTFNYIKQLIRTLKLTDETVPDWRDYMQPQIKELLALLDDK